MFHRRYLWGIPLDDGTSEDVQNTLRGLLTTSKGPAVVTTPNPEFLLQAKKDQKFLAILSKADLSLPDGAGVQLAVLALTGERIAHRHPGANVVEAVFRLAGELELSIALVGGYKNDVDAIIRDLLRRWPEIRIEGVDPGIIDERVPRLPEAAMSALLRFAPDIILVALGQGKGKRQGKQEKVMQQLAEAFPKTKLLMGIGGTLDFLAGRSKRAPERLQNLRLEWLWRLLHEPWRWRRIIRAVVVFPVIVAVECIRAGRFTEACRAVWQELRHR